LIGHFVAARSLVRGSNEGTYIILVFTYDSILDNGQLTNLSTHHLMVLIIISVCAVKRNECEPYDVVGMVLLALLSSYYCACCTSQNCPLYKDDEILFLGNLKIG
jgi:hypothetical protein